MTLSSHTALHISGVGLVTADLLCKTFILSFRGYFDSWRHKWFVQVSEETESGLTTERTPVTIALKATVSVTLATL